MFRWVMYLAACVFPLLATAVGLADEAQNKGKYLGAFNDPVAYCRVVVNADNPEEPYIGPAKPQMVLTGIYLAAGISAGAPRDWVAGGTFWRCMDGGVYACFIGANLPCKEKANTSKEPSEAITAYCKSNPASKSIPAVVTGRVTIYEWHCENSVPEITRQALQVDKRGFIANYWYRMDRP
ncbi:hypothetical protein Misp06_00637 [Microbulbifer sp. NBRC 101763]|uniref:hypothetical protein n=1 Tax=Microbulbifer TaxID=48073 RepID=UPI00035C5B30|nr:hypothetical protein [Microbulbifer variabilis]